MSQPGTPIDLPPPPPLRPRGVGEILSAAFDLYGRYWRTLIPLVAVVVVPLTILQYALNDVLWGDVRIREEEILTLEEAGELWERAAGSMLLGAITVFITLILVGAVAWSTAGALVGREPDLGEAYRFGAARMWSVLLVSVLTGLAVAGGFILFVIPGFIFLTRFAVSVPALVIEGKRGTAALSRSWDLVTGHSWPVLGALLVAGLITGAVSGILTAPFADSWFLRGSFASIGSVITTPFMALVLGLVYFDLRVRKDGLDVAGLEQELRTAAP